MAVGNLSLHNSIRTAGLVMLAGLMAAPPAAAQTRFASAEGAASALVQATQAGDTNRILAILGPGSTAAVGSGDPAERRDFVVAYNARHVLVPKGDARMVLEIGPNDWALPIPLVRHGDMWSFDSREGVQEILNRRIGRNEISAIRVCLAYADAQQDYFDLFKQVTGVGAYAQHLVSTAHNYDGLYWPPAPSVPLSPFSALVSQAQAEGYPMELVAGQPAPYRGYFFRILTAQGANAPDGARDYVMNGRMTGGFALVAWPANYGASGIMTFVVDRDGVAFQKDLGPDTAARAAAIRRYDPDLSWARVDITQSPGGPH